MDKVRKVPFFFEIIVFRVGSKEKDPAFKAKAVVLNHVSSIPSKVVLDTPGVSAPRLDRIAAQHSIKKSAEAKVLFKPVNFPEAISIKVCFTCCFRISVILFLNNTAAGLS